MNDPGELPRQQLIERWAALTASHLQGTLTEDEQLEWEMLLRTHPHFRDWFSQFNEEKSSKALVDKYARFSDQVNFARMQFQSNIASVNAIPVSRETSQVNETALPDGPAADQQPVRRMHWFPQALFRYAAAIILIAGATDYLWKINQKTDAPVRKDQKDLVTDIAPGRDGAILTLADGSQVVLDSLPNGVIATQNGTRVVMKNGSLAYTPGGKQSEDIVFNTMSTPNGRQFQLVLPDGSKVWLNAASSIRYPTFFSGNERVVEINGEAYFEVAKNTKMAFRVKINNGPEVEALGTSFNINAYENENAITTTLLTGSVRVNANQQAETLKPGQQAVTGQSRRMTVINDADTDKAIAWKNGIFNFEDASLEQVMRQLSRWYDLEIIYEKGIPNIQFAGKIHRDVSLAGVLKGLKGAKVNFRMDEGRRLVVVP